MMELSTHRVRHQRPVASSAACGKRMTAVANGAGLGELPEVPEVLAQLAFQ